MGNALNLPRRSPDTIDWVHGCCVAGAALACILAVATYATLATLVTWGHDEVHYYASFEFKLVEDGRWLNFLLHDLLRSLPAPTWALGWVAGWAVLLYGVARDLGRAQADSALVAATALLAVPLAEQSLWPATTAPALAILLILQWLARRKVHPAVIYLGGGAIMFGSMQSFYFLLPLFFLADQLDPQSSPATRWRRVLLHWAWWVGGAIVGVLAMSSMVWVLSGQFGVEPAAWRMTQPIEQTSDIVRNLAHVTVALTTQSIHLARTTGLSNWWIGAGIALMALTRVRDLPSALPAIAMLVAVALGFFAMSVPLAPVIQTRSLVALWTVVFVGLALLPGDSRVGRALGTLVMVAMAWHLAIASGSYLRSFDSETRTMRDQIARTLPLPVSAYARVALFGVFPEGAPNAALYNDTPRMHGLLHAMGARDYMDCRTGADARCAELPLPSEGWPPTGNSGSDLGHVRLPEGTAVVFAIGSPAP
jgi:hypothetical protein